MLRLLLLSFANRFAKAITVAVPEASSLAPLPIESPSKEFSSVRFHYERPIPRRKLWIDFGKKFSIDVPEIVTY